MNTWRGNKVNKKKVCLLCNSEFLRTKHNTKVFNRQKFCNRRCWKRWFNGRNHHQWKSTKIHFCIYCKAKIQRHNKSGRCRICFHKGIGTIKISTPERLREQKRIAENKRRAIKKKVTVGEFTIKDWEDIKRKNNLTCLICKKTEPTIKLTIDHIIPLSKNGEHSKVNIQPLCRRCNSSKYNNLKPLIHES